MDLKLPALGEGADSGTVVNLFVKEGDPVTMISRSELENEKAVATIPSTAAGKVGKILLRVVTKSAWGSASFHWRKAGLRKGRKGKAAPKAEGAPAPKAEEEESESGATEDATAPEKAEAAKDGEEAPCHTAPPPPRPPLHRGFLSTPPRAAPGAGGGFY